MSAKQRATNGLKLLLNKKEPFTQVQVCWRFLNNKNVTVEKVYSTYDNYTSETLKFYVKNRDDTLISNVIERIVEFSMIHGDTR